MPPIFKAAWVDRGKFPPLTRTLKTLTSLNKEVRLPPLLSTFLSDESALEALKVKLLFCLGIAGKRKKNGGLTSLFKEVRVFKEFSCKIIPRDS